MPTLAAPVMDTARRLEWRFLPPHVRDLVEDRCGSPVVTDESCTRGFASGFASVLTCRDGERYFVKAASSRAQAQLAAAHREEARTLRALPAGVPAPRLLWTLDGDWVVLGIEHVAGRHPHRPWGGDDLDACLDALERVAAAAAPPEELRLPTAVDELAPLVGQWDAVRVLHPELAHVDEARQLAARYAEVVGGSGLVHAEVRDDNVLLAAGRAWICDWNWPMRGAPWLDSVLLLVGPRGDGVDVDVLAAERPLLRDVPADDVDTLLALSAASFLKAAADPVPPTSPRLREHQRWYGEACWDWLCERRGWA